MPATAARSRRCRRDCMVAATVVRTRAAGSPPSAREDPRGQRRERGEQAQQLPRAAAGVVRDEGGSIARIARGVRGGTCRRRAGRSRGRCGATAVMRGRRGRVAAVAARGQPQGERRPSRRRRPSPRVPGRTAAARRRPRRPRRARATARCRARGTSAAIACGRRAVGLFVAAEREVHVARGGEPAASRFSTASSMTSSGPLSSSAPRP